MTVTGNSLEAGKVIQFANNISLIGQQLKNRLVPHVDADLAFMEKGDRFTDETFGMSHPVDVTQDWVDSPEGEVDQYRRVARGKSYQDGKSVGSKDRAEKLIDPSNSTVKAMAAGRERRRDEVILQRGIFAPSMQEIDPDGNETTVVFPTKQIIAVDDVKYFRGKADGVTSPATPGAGAGLRTLTPAKIRAMKKILSDGEDEQFTMPVLLYEEQDLLNLLTSVELTDADITNVKRLEQGEIENWMGVKFVKVNPGKLPLVPGTTDQYYTGMYLPEYVKYKDRPLVSTRIVERADKSFNWYAFYKAQDYALRCRDSAVVWGAIER